ncbi:MULTISPECIES: DUF72 domain-containing protein [Enterococcaceae]|uniref:DUF72 domain-containing protein n=1 Tax=Enterococcaceae TaxID=81852 RepID=UPI000E4B1751|nr:MULTISPECIES: DUF72 domain-containing protein [Enterococcaceae]RGI32233.1 DUF72 domain-containing protein [Melissococcus sp. OM08-11BH]UNM89942.1 DUF72 domain-containing protein [Vagococcus sp. CY52-2]
MIEIGLTTFKEHGKLLNKSFLALSDYASLFPVVEMNTSFYGIKQPTVSQKWVDETPESFSFSVKAFKVMTKHAKIEEFYQSEEEMDDAFKLFLMPLIQQNRLSTILCQFPSFFICNKPNVEYLRKLRLRFKEFPMAIEFRSGTWYNDSVKQDMIEFMKQYHYTLVTVDEPQVAHHSVPFLPKVTTKDYAYLRLHGRNKRYWTEKSGDWRKKRTLYRYSDSELNELAKDIKQIEAKKIVVVFNNNSGGDAGENALTLKNMLAIDYKGLNPTQLNLF